MREKNRPVDFGYVPWTEMFSTYAVDDAHMMAVARRMAKIVLPKGRDPYGFTFQITAGLMEMQHNGLKPWTVMRGRITDDGEEGETSLFFTSDEDAVLARMFVDG